MTVFIFLAVLLILVLVHEAGHFLTARLFGLRVYEFGFGFPPRLLGLKRLAGKWRWFRGTEQIVAADADPVGTVYSLNALPIGGFVRIHGEQGEDTNDPTSFAARPIWQRSLVVLAGVLGNILLAWLLFSGGLMAGVPSIIPEKVPSYVTIKDRAIQVESVVVNSPAAEALAPGDTLLKIDTWPIDRLVVVPEYVVSHGDAAINLTIKRGQEIKNVTVTPRRDEQNVPRLGVQIVETGIIRLPWYRALWEGARTTGDVAVQIVQAFAGLFTNLVQGRPLGADVTGPVGIAVITGQVAKLGLAHLLQFVAMLSVNLALINVLPFPALDGGRFLFLMIERVRGRAIVARVENLIHTVGFVILLTLVVLVTYRDVAHYGAGFFQNLGKALGL